MTIRGRFRRTAFELAIIAMAGLPVPAVLGAAADRGPSARSLSAADAIRAAVASRFGAGVDVAIESTGVSADAPVFREARPDPSALVGKPVRFTLITEAGAAVPVSVVMTVTADYVVAAHAIERGHLVTAADIETRHGVITDVPMRPLLASRAVVGARALRRIAAGSTVLPAYVSARRVIEPGDHVTAVVAGGAVEVTADFVAADGGQIGDRIRVVNPVTKRYLRGRIVKEGWVEVTDGH